MTELETLWRDVPMNKLDVNGNIIKALDDAEITTVGMVADFGDLTKIDGIAKPSAIAVAQAIEKLRESLDENGSTDSNSNESSTDTPEPAKPPGAANDQSKSNPPDDEDTPPANDEDTADDSAGDGNEGGLTDEELIDRTDEETRQQMLEAIGRLAQQEDEDGLYRMLAKGKQEDDIGIIQIVTAELNLRFEKKRYKQVEFSVPLRFSDLKRDGYGVSESSVPRNIHRHRISHPAAVALAKLRIAMSESGEKLKSGRRVTKNAHVIEKILEAVYEEIEGVNAK